MRMPTQFIYSTKMAFGRFQGNDGGELLCPLETSTSGRWRLQWVATFAHN